jgi:hypothetical protein
MAESLLDQIHSQIRDRVRELEPAAREYERLDAALTALGGPVEARSARPAPLAKPEPTARRQPRTPTSRGRGSATVL